MGATLSATSQGGRNPYPANSEMNVTPFVDVMLVLLIIFMIAAPLSTVSVPVELPPASTKPIEVKPQEPIFVSIDKEGAVFLMNEKVTMADLPVRLKEKVAGNPDERIYLRADQNLQYRKVMDVMSLLQDSGFFKVGLVAEEVLKAEAGS